MRGLAAPLALCCAISMLCAGNGAQLSAAQAQPGRLLPIPGHTWRKLAGRWSFPRLTECEQQRKPPEPRALRTSAGDEITAAFAAAGSLGSTAPAAEEATDAVRRATARDVLAVLSGATLKRRSWVR